MPYDDSQARDKSGMWTSGGSSGGGLPPSAYAAGMAKAPSSNIRIRGGTPKQQESVKLAISHLDDDQRALVKQVAIADLGARTAARMKADGATIDVRTLEQNPAYTASVLAHEIEHLRMSAAGVPSSKQENRARMKGALWAGRKAGRSKHGSAEWSGFNKAMREQQPSWPTVKGT